MSAPAAFFKPATKHELASLLELEAKSNEVPV